MHSLSHAVGFIAAHLGWAVLSAAPWSSQLFSKAAGLQMTLPRCGALLSPQRELIPTTILLWHAEKTRTAVNGMLEPGKLKNSKEHRIGVAVSTDGIEDDLSEKLCRALQEKDGWSTTIPRAASGDRVFTAVTDASQPIPISSVKQQMSSSSTDDP